MNESDVLRQRIAILAGPNGAGKTTIAISLFQQLGIEIALNADDLARGLSSVNPDRAAFEAGELLLQKIDELAGLGDSFGFETTLAGKTLLRRVEHWRSLGIEISIDYLWLESADLAVARVATRVMAGGHSIPWDTIHRRYTRSIRNFMNLYRSLTSNWRLYNNSVVPNDDFPLLVAEGRGEQVVRINDQRSWQRIQIQANVT